MFSSNSINVIILSLLLLFSHQLFHNNLSFVKARKLPRYGFNGCINDCNNHGKCDYYHRCVCEDGYTAADCSQRVCPSGPAWADKAWAMDRAHALTECSNRGMCDRSTGECQCTDGFEGNACHRISCPSDCGEFGKCMTIGDMYGRYTNLGPSIPDNYTGWDAHSVTSCVCDMGVFGTSCQYKMCPKGDDPLTTSTGFRTVRINTYSNVGSHLLRGFFRFSFNGFSFLIPVDISSWTESTCTNAFQSLANVETASCRISRSNSTIVAQLKTFPVFPHENNIYTYDGTTSTGIFGCDTILQSGVDLSEASCNVTDITSSSAVLPEYALCSNRGLCNLDTGLCSCFSGFSNPNCDRYTPVDVSVMANQPTDILSITATSPYFTGSILNLGIVYEETSANPPVYFINGSNYPYPALAWPNVVSKDVFVLDSAGNVEIEGGWNLAALSGSGGVKVVNGLNVGLGCVSIISGGVVSDQAAILWNGIAIKGGLYITQGLTLQSVGLNVYNGITLRSGGIKVTSSGINVGAGGVTIAKGGFSVSGSLTIGGSGLFVTKKGVTISDKGLVVSGGVSIVGGPLGSGLKTDLYISIMSGGLYINGDGVTGGMEVYGAGLRIQAGGASVYDNGLYVSGGFTATGGVFIAGGLQITSNRLQITGGMTIHSGGLVVQDFLKTTGGMTIRSGGLGLTGGVTVRNGGTKITGGFTIYNSGLIVSNGISVQGYYGLKVTGGYTINNGGISVVGLATVTNALLCNTGGVTVGFEGLYVTHGMTVNTGGLKITNGLTIGTGGFYLDTGGISGDSGLRLYEGVTGVTIFDSGLVVSGGLTIKSGGFFLNSASGVTIHNGGLSSDNGITIFDSGMSVTGGFTVSSGSLSVSQSGMTIGNGGLILSGGLTIHSNGLISPDVVSITGDGGIFSTEGMSIPFGGGIAATGGLTLTNAGLWLQYGGIISDNSGLNVYGGMTVDFLSSGMGSGMTIRGNNGLRIYDTGLTIRSSGFNTKYGGSVYGNLYVRFGGFSIKSGGLKVTQGISVRGGFVSTDGLQVSSRGITAPGVTIGNRFKTFGNVNVTWGEVYVTGGISIASTGIIVRTGASIDSLVCSDNNAASMGLKINTNGLVITDGLSIDNQLLITGKVDIQDGFKVNSMLAVKDAGLGVSDGLTISTGGLRIIDDGVQVFGDFSAGASSNSNINTGGLWVDGLLADPLNSIAADRFDAALEIQKLAVLSSSSVDIQQNGLVVTGIEFFPFTNYIRSDGLLISDGGLTIYGETYLNAENQSVHVGPFDFSNAALTGSQFSLSDRRLKTNIAPILEPLEKVKKLKGVYYSWGRSAQVDLLLDDRRHVGLFAQDVQEVLPECLSTSDDGNYLGVTYTDLVPVLVEAIKELLIHFNELINRDLDYGRKETIQKQFLSPYQKNETESKSNELSTNLFSNTKTNRKRSYVSRRIKEIENRIQILEFNDKELERLWSLSTSS